MARFGAALSLLLFSAVGGGILVLPDATVTFWVPFENPNDALDYLKPFLSRRGLDESGQRHVRNDGVFSVLFHSRSMTRLEVAVNGHAAGEKSNCTVVDSYFFAEGYDMHAHTKGSVRNNDAMDRAFELASDLAAWLQTSGAEDIKVMQAEANADIAGSIGCMRSNNALERP
mgnify:CR=1 FL=1